ncbi:hypothetical protein [Luteimonas sp. A649]
MHPVIHFQSRLFDVSLEPENPNNQIAGTSLLEWLRARVPADVAMPAPQSEDWGWYSDVNWRGRDYMIGASANESTDGNHEWVLQIVKSRSIKERLLGKAKMLSDDPCFSYFHGLIMQEPAFTDISVERGP